MYPKTKLNLPPNNLNNPNLSQNQKKSNHTSIPSASDKTQKTQKTREFDQRSSKKPLKNNSSSPSSPSSPSLSGSIPVYAAASHSAGGQSQKSRANAKLTRLYNTSPSYPSANPPFATISNNPTKRFFSSNSSLNSNSNSNGAIGGDSKELSTYDVVIVGAGIMGLNIAYQLKRRDSNLKIVVLEKAPGIGYGSSGYSTGFLRSITLITPYNTIIYIITLCSQ